MPRLMGSRVSVAFAVAGAVICCSLRAAARCYSSGSVDVSTVSIYGGDQVILTLTNPNACGITTQTTATVTFTDADGVVYSASDAEALSATSVTFITPQFQR